MERVHHRVVGSLWHRELKSGDLYETALEGDRRFRLAVEMKNLSAPVSARPSAGCGTGCSGWED